MTDDVDAIALHVAVIVLAYERLLQNALHAFRADDDDGVNRNLAAASSIIEMMTAASVAMTESSDAISASIPGNTTKDEHL